PVRPRGAGGPPRRWSAWTARSAPAGRPGSAHPARAGGTAPRSRSSRAAVARSRRGGSRPVPPTGSLPNSYRNGKPDHGARQSRDGTYILTGGSGVLPDITLNSGYTAHTVIVASLPWSP